ncbi:MAG: hypothetical protein HUK15_06390 [Bacteroidales bacterium]|nr:hypothetical protein [Bacteroidales bacterium]
MKKLLILAVLTCALACQNAQNPENQTEQNQEQNSEEQTEQTAKLSLEDLESETLYQCVEQSSFYFYFVGFDSESSEYYITLLNAEKFEDICSNREFQWLTGNLADDKFVMKIDDTDTELYFQLQGEDIVLTSKGKFNTPFPSLDKYTFKKVDESKLADKFDASALISATIDPLYNHDTGEKSINFFDEITFIKFTLSGECDNNDFKITHLDGDKYKIKVIGYWSTCDEESQYERFEDGEEQEITITPEGKNLVVTFTKEINGLKPGKKYVFKPYAE